MTSQFAKLLAFTTAPIFCAGFAAMPDAAGLQDAGNSSILSPSRLVSNDELSQMRGGFFTAAGAQFDFGASVQTMVNGKLALLTNVQWTPAGAVTQQLQGLGSAVQAQVADSVATGLANAGIATPGSSVQTATTANSTPAAPMPATATATSAPTSSALAGAAPATSLATNSPAASAPAASAATTASTPAAAAPAASLAANSPAASASAPIAPAAAAPVASLAAGTPAVSSPATATAAAPATASAAGGAAPLVLTGVQIPGASGGLTQIFANIAGGQIQNVILNSASGQDITQNTNITMTIYNFAAWQQQVAQNMLSGRLASDMLAASGIGAGH